jgi:signal peptidase I
MLQQFETNKQVPVSNQQSQIDSFFTIRDFFEAIGFAVIVALLLKMFVVDMFQIPSHSMSPTLQEGDFILVSKVSYSWGLPNEIPFTSWTMPFATYRISLQTINRNDVVVFKFPNKEVSTDYFIKRVVGIPGDKIVLTENEVYINGKNERSLPHNHSLVGVRTPSLRLDDSVFISVPKIGESIQLTTENLAFWKQIIESEGNEVLLNNANIYINGKQTQTYTFTENYYYVLGDNRLNSYDSRYWGFVPQRTIIGKPLFIYWSSAKDTLLRSDRIGTWIY